MTDERTPPQSEYDIPVERMGEQLLQAMIDELRTTGASWQQLSKSQQDAVIGRLKSRIRHETGKAVALIAAGSREIVRVKVEQLTVKDGAKVQLTMTQSAHPVVDYVGNEGILVLCDPEQYFGGMDSIEGEDDQRGLDLHENAA